MVRESLAPAIRSTTLEVVRLQLIGTIVDISPKVDGSYVASVSSLHSGSVHRDPGRWRMKPGTG